MLQIIISLKYQTNIPIPVTLPLVVAGVSIDQHYSGFWEVAKRGTIAPIQLPRLVDVSSGGPGQYRVATVIFTNFTYNLALLCIFKVEIFLTVPNSFKIIFKTFFDFRISFAIYKYLWYFDKDHRFQVTHIPCKRCFLIMLKFNLFHPDKIE